MENDGRSFGEHGATSEARRRSDTHELSEASRLRPANQVVARAPGDGRCLHAAFTFLHVNGGADRSVGVPSEKNTERNNSRLS